MQINTNAPVLHDCQCTIGGRPATRHGTYRGFIWHEWDASSVVCLLPFETSVEEAGAIMGIGVGGFVHWLGGTEGKTFCIYPVTDYHAVIDRFWETVREGLADAPALN